MLNEAQQKAVDTTADKVVVIAGAGSGKTHILVERLTRLKESGVDPESILVLTFTNAAAREMTERYKRKNEGKTPKFGTFHAFCYSLICTDSDIRRKMGYSAPPTLATPADIQQIMSEVRIMCGTTISDSKLNDPDRLKPNEQFQYDIFWKQYNKMFRQRNLITFDIMCDEVSEMFSANDPITDKYKSKYKYVMLDEAQDSNHTNVDFMLSFTESKLFMVGDFRQALYRFRGADSSIIKGFADDPEWETIVLSENYRSTKQIVDYANHIHKLGSSALDVNMKSDRDGIDVEFRSGFDYNSTESIMSIVQDKTDGNTVAILCRTNAEVDEVKSALYDMRIPYITNNANKTIIEYLYCSIDSEYFVKYLSSDLSREEYIRYLKVSSTENINEEEFVKLFGQNFKYALRKIMDIRKILSENTLVSIMFTNLVNYLKVNVDVALGLSCNNIQDVVNTLADELDVQCDTGIYVGTIHSSKGLEYNVVHVIGVNGPHFDPNRNEDEQNCYYVACTRAKDKLVIWDSNVQSTVDVEGFGYGKYHIE